MPCLFLVSLSSLISCLLGSLSLLSIYLFLSISMALSFSLSIYLSLYLSLSMARCDCLIYPPTPIPRKDGPANCCLCCCNGGTLRSVIFHGMDTLPSIAVAVTPGRRWVLTLMLTLTLALILTLILSLFLTLTFTLDAFVPDSIAHASLLNLPEVALIENLSVEVFECEGHARLRITSSNATRQQPPTLTPTLALALIPTPTNPNSKVGADWRPG
jgi:hypothetical protein